MPLPENAGFKNPITEDTKYWFGELIQFVAIEHDLGGPDISLVEVERYRNEVTGEIRRRALASRATGQVKYEMADLEALSQLAADELIRLRQIRHAHSRGTFPTAAMRQLPVYKVYKQYLDEDPELVQLGLAAALAKDRARKDHLPDVTEQNEDRDKRAKPLKVTKQFSDKTEQWLEVQVLGFAAAEDMSGKSCIGIDEAKYIDEASPRFRQNILQAIEIGNLTIEASEVDNLCRHAAVKALRLRRLKARYDKKQISRRKLKAVPEYRAYHEYLESQPVMESLMQYAAFLREALGQQKSAKTN